MFRRLLPYVVVALISVGLTIVLQPQVHLQALAQADCHTFTETGKTVCGKFLSYWRNNGGLAQQGYPISSEFVEVSDLNGQPYTVQYFERAVFEMHPENPPPFDVLLSQLGTYQFQRKYPNGEPVGGTPRPTATARASATTTAMPTATPGGDPPRITLQEFKALYDDPAKRPIILDVRAPASYEEGHIKGAISFPEVDVDRRVGELPKDKLIVAYCQ
jgi:hypothetical protein